MLRWNILPIVIVLVCLLALPSATQPAQAGSTFNVNTTADTVDSNPGDGICRDSSYACSLRAAIMEANAIGGSSAHYIYLLPGKIHTLSLDTDGGGHVTDAGPSTDDLDITANIVIMGNFATIQRTGSCTIDDSAATGEFRIFEVHSGGKLTLQDVTVRDGCADGLVDNGGGIAVQSGGELTVINSALTGHRARNQGGGIYSNGTVTILNSTLAGNSASQGGGVLNGLSVTMTIRNSTFSGNTAGNDGGGIFNFGTLTLTNSTLSSNSAGWAGGILQSGNMAKLSFVTVAENSGKGIMVISGSSTLQIRHSIVAKNTGGNCYIVVGTFIPSGNNFADDNTCTGFAALTPSTLGPLASNGGATQTHALFPGSEAINAASDCQDLEGNTVSTDQRGVLRPQGGVCDAGAYERDDNTPPTVLAITRADPNPTSAASVAFSVTFSEVVTGVDAGDFTLVTTGSIGGASVTGVSGTGSVYTVTVNTGTGSGTLRLDLKASGTGIQDLAGNPITGGFTSGEEYTVDKTAPTVVSITRADPNPTNAASVQFIVTFSEGVTGVDAGDFSLTTTGSISGASVTGVSGAGSVYTVTVSTGTGSGTLRLDIPGTATVTDPAGNSLSNLPYTSGQVYNKLTSLFLPLVHK